MEGLQEFGMAKFNTKYSNGTKCIFICPLHIYGIDHLSSLLKCSLITEKQALLLENMKQPTKGHVVSFCHKTN